MSAINTPRRAFVALLLVFSALAVPGCGGEDPQELVKQTFDGNAEPIRSGQISIGFTLTPRGSPQLTRPFQLRLSGPFQGQGKGKLPKFDMNANVAAEGQTFTAGAVSTGSAGFLKVQGRSYALPPSLLTGLQRIYQQAQAEADAERRNRNNASSVALGIDPRSWLTEAKTEGDEKVGDADTTHVSARVDVPKLVRDINEAAQQARARGLPQASQLPDVMTPENQRKITNAIKGVTFNFWTGKDDKVLRRLAVDLRFEVPPEERANSQGLTGGSLAFNYRLTALNEPQQITAPANPRPLEELRSALGGSFLGGLLGGAGAGAAPGGGGAQGANQAYQRCLQKAGSDIARQQRCAALLGR